MFVVSLWPAYAKAAYSKAPVCTDVDGWVGEMCRRAEAEANRQAVYVLETGGRAANEAHEKARELCRYMDPCVIPPAP